MYTYLSHYNTLYNDMTGYNNSMYTYFITLWKTLQSYYNYCTAHQLQAYTTFSNDGRPNLEI